jgi:hypothetical protein
LKILFSHCRINFVILSIDIQSLPTNTYDDLWSNTIEHLSTTQQRKHIIQSSTSIKLLDCTIDHEQILNIALADKVVKLDISIEKLSHFFESVERFIFLFI